MTTERRGPGDPWSKLWATVAPRVTAALTRRWGDFCAAEDAVQEALVDAWAQWSLGPPANPGAWLYRVAQRRLVDQVRSETSRRRREVDWAPPEGEASLGTDTLDLLFLCADPRLSPGAAVALTLRAVVGFDHAQIGAALLVPPKTAAQRVARAKATLNAGGPVGFDLSEADRRARLPGVQKVLYLLFNEGYSRSQGTTLMAPDLVAEALVLTRRLDAQVGDPETQGLLALMLLTDARRPARSGPAGELVPLERQDRGLWDQGTIAEGLALVEAALPRPGVGPYRVQAAIAALHDQAPTPGDTDWTQITALYTVLARIAPSPMTDLNLVVALGRAEGPRAAEAELVRLDLDRRLSGHHRLNVVRARLAQDAGNLDRAVSLYRRAANQTPSGPERSYLRELATELESGRGT